MLDYTWAQFEQFCAAVERLEKQRLRTEFNQMLFATRGNEDAVKDYWQQLKT